MRRTTAQNFFAKVYATKKCWLWMGAVSPEGYGSFGVNCKTVRAHRHAYKLFRGEIPSGLELDHLCKNPSCVNPWHLEPVTHKTNVLRGTKATQTHCIRGHEFNETNTKFRPGGQRDCRACNNLYTNNRYHTNQKYREWRMEYYKTYKRPNKRAS